MTTTTLMPERINQPPSKTTSLPSEQGDSAETALIEADTEFYWRVVRRLADPAPRLLSEEEAFRRIGNA